jgi:hypothetical protein
MRTALLALALSIGNLVTAHAADVVVTTCGTVVPSGDKGTLQANLDCSAAPASQPAVVLANRASLSLGGFTLTGAVDGIGVRCARHCTVTGPGTITSVPAGSGSMRAACIQALRDPGEAPRSQKLKIEDLNLDGCGYGVGGDTGSHGAKLTVTNVAADGNDVGFIGAGIRARDVSATNGSGAGFLVPTGKMIGINIHADGNDPIGVEAARMSLTDSTAIGNTAFGVLASTGATKLRGTTVTGSGIRDVLSARPPQVSQLTCGTSARWIPPNGIGAPWGVCAGD